MPNNVGQKRPHTSSGQDTSNQKRPTIIRVNSTDDLNLPALPAISAYGDQFADSGLFAHVDPFDTRSSETDSSDETGTMPRSPSTNSLGLPHIPEFLHKFDTATAPATASSPLSFSESDASSNDDENYSNESYGNEGRKRVAVKKSPRVLAAVAKYTPIADQEAWKEYIGDSTREEKRNKVRAARRWVRRNSEMAPPFLREKFLKKVSNF